MCRVTQIKKKKQASEFLKTYYQQLGPRISVQLIFFLAAEEKIGLVSGQPEHSEWFRGGQTTSSRPISLKPKVFCFCFCFFTSWKKTHFHDGKKIERMRLSDAGNSLNYDIMWDTYKHSHV
jgi:hypothetical protein